MRRRVFYVICMLFVTGGLIFICRSNWCQNGLALFYDAIDYGVNGSDGMCEWRFVPEEDGLDWVDCRCSVEFNPVKPRRHRVFLRIRKDSVVNESSVRKLMTGVSFTVILQHASSGDVFHDIKGLGPISAVVAERVNNVDYFRAEIFEFYPYDFPWKYSDRIRISVYPYVFGVDRDVFCDYIKKGLTVGEYFPFY